LAPTEYFSFFKIEDLYHLYVTVSENFVKHREFFYANISVEAVSGSRGNLNVDPELQHWFPVSTAKLIGDFWNIR
jgi:uncharacterized membrane protein YobD (UPF0266 family)